MKKIIIAVIIALAGIGGGIYLYIGHQKKQAAAAEARQPNQWKIESIGNYQVLSVPIDNDSAFTDALTAMIAEKMGEEKVPVSMEVRLSDTKTDLTTLAHIGFRLTFANGSSISDTLTISQKDSHHATGLFCFDAAKIQNSKNMETSIADLKQIYTRSGIKCAISPEIEEGDTLWVELPLTDK